MGAGKTTVAKLLHPKLDRTAYIGLDRIKRYITGFRKVPSRNEVSRGVVAKMVEEYLRQRISVILDQSMSKEEISSYRRMGRKHGAKDHVFQLDAPRGILNSRIHLRTEELLKPRVTKAHIDRHYNDHLKRKYPATVVFDSKAVSARQIANRILKELQRR